MNLSISDELELFSK
ncbi:Protein of unknown function [Bacillus cytotoxicus]|uniref:Uncharacterized protein n=3 Tax=Bacillus cereus group TaxID=86661 RepID=A0AAX2CFP2_9BACI|nr:Protein of unknown function [Bacillus cytotoxicus]